MAVHMAINNKRNDNRMAQEKLREEAKTLLSLDNLGTRITQLDGIIRRKASKVLFSMETGDKSNGPAPMGQDQNRKYSIVQELLTRVRLRRRMVRSYIYLSWFTIFFMVFLMILYLQEDNSNRYSVDVSILNRITRNLLGQSTVTSNGIKYMPGDAQFYEWMGQTVKTVFTETRCGDGSCDGPEEFAGIGRFGCVSDCGSYSQRTPLRFDFKPAWRNSPAGNDVSKIIMGDGDKMDIKFKWNVWSETMGDYILGKDSDAESLIADVPDGRMTLELYQETLVAIDTSALDMGQFGNFAQDTLMTRDTSQNDWVYGDKAEASAIAATANRQIKEYCTVGAGVSEAGCANYTVAATGVALTQMYGISGNVSMSSGKGAGRTTILSVPYCTVDPADLVAAALPASRCDGASTCYDASRLYLNFKCASKYSFQVWRYGDIGRAVNVRDTSTKMAARTLTPFNNLIGSLVITQYKRMAVDCELSSNADINKLISQYPCQGGKQTKPFGSDPAFLSFSSLYNGKLSPLNFYNTTEFPPQVVSPDGVAFRGNPYGFYPHEWGRGGPKDDVYIHEKDIGKYKIYFDGRLSASQALDRVTFFQDGHFLNSQTSMIEVEMITYNADFAIFGVVTFQFIWDLGGSIQWDYQYNTAELLPYRALRGSALLLCQIIFGILLLVDMIREIRDVIYAARHDNLWKGYLSRPMKYLNWLHYGLLFTSFGVWASYCTLTASTTLKPSYPVLVNLAGKARMFETNPGSEYDMLRLIDKMRQIADTKNIYTSINSLCVLLFITRILKILDFQPRMALITRTLKEAGTDLMHFLILFFIVLLGYATMGCVLFGGQIIKFQNLVDAMITLIFVVLGWDTSVFREMVTAANTQQVLATKLAFYLFYWSWIIISTFVLLNVILAIVVDAYASVKRESTDSRTMPSEMLEVAKETTRAMGNRCFGTNWNISDHMLEKILVKQAEKYSSRAKMRHAMGAMNMATAKRPQIRIKGGIVMESSDVVELLKGCGSRGKSLIDRARGLKDTVKRVASGASGSNVLTEPGLTFEQQAQQAEADDDVPPPKAVEELMARYGTIVDESMDDPDMLRLLKVENVRRQLAMYTSQESLKQQISALCDVVAAISTHTIPEEARQKLEGDRLIRNAQDGGYTVGLDQIMGLTGSVSGVLTVTVVAAKNIPKLDTFTESDPYAVLIIEGSANYGDEHQEPFGRTRTKKNQPHPVWEEHFEIETVVGPHTNLVVAILDDDKGDDDLVGKITVQLCQLPVGQEVDMWYHVNPHPGGRAAAALRSVFNLRKEPPMLRIRSRFTAYGDNLASLNGADTGHNSGTATGTATPSLTVKSALKEGEIEWLRAKLGSVNPKAEHVGGLVVKVLRGEGFGVKGAGCVVRVATESGRELGTEVVEVEEWCQTVHFNGELRFESYMGGGITVKAMTSGVNGKKGFWQTEGSLETIDEVTLELLSGTDEEYAVTIGKGMTITLLWKILPIPKVLEEAHVLNSVGHAEIARCHALPGHATAASDEAFCEPSAAFLGKGSEDAVQPATLDLAGAGAVEDIRVECDVVLEGGASQRKLSDQNAIREIVSSGAIDGAGDSQVGWKSSAKPVLRKSSFNVLMQPSSSLSPRFVRIASPKDMAARTCSPLPVSSAGRNQSAEVLSPESDALLQPPTLNLASDGNDETDEKAATSAGHADVHVSIPAEHRGNGLPRLFEVANSTDVAGGAEIYEDSANSVDNYSQRTGSNAGINSGIRTSSASNSSSSLRNSPVPRLIERSNPADSCGPASGHLSIACTPEPVQQINPGVQVASVDLKSEARGATGSGSATGTFSAQGGEC